MLTAILTKIEIMVARGGRARLVLATTAAVLIAAMHIAAVAALGAALAVAAVTVRVVTVVALLAVSGVEMAVTAVTGRAADHPLKHPSAEADYRSSRL